MVWRWTGNRGAGRGARGFTEVEEVEVVGVKRKIGNPGLTKQVAVHRMSCPRTATKRLGRRGMDHGTQSVHPVLATVHYTDFPLCLSLLRSKKTSIGKNAGRKNAKRRLRRLPIVRMLQAYKQADPNVPHNCVLVRWAYR